MAIVDRWADPTKTQVVATCICALNSAYVNMYGCDFMYFQ